MDANVPGPGQLWADLRYPREEDGDFHLERWDLAEEVLQEAMRKVDFPLEMLTGFGPRRRSGSGSGCWTGSSEGPAQESEAESDR